MRDFLYLTLVPSVCIATAVVSSHYIADKYKGQITAKINALKNKIKANNVAAAPVVNSAAQGK